MSNPTHYDRINRNQSNTRIVRGITALGMIALAVYAIIAPWAVLTVFAFAIIFTLPILAIFVAIRAVLVTRNIAQAVSEWQWIRPSYESDPFPTSDTD